MTTIIIFLTTIIVAVIFGKYLTKQEIDIKKKAKELIPIVEGIPWQKFENDLNILPDLSLILENYNYEEYFKKYRVKRKKTKLIYFLKEISNS